MLYLDEKDGLPQIWYLQVSYNVRKPFFALKVKRKLQGIVGTKI